MNKPKILLFDIENSPNISYTWGKYEQDVIDFQSEWYMLSFAYKWLGEDKVYCKSLPDYKTYKKDKTNDIELVTDLWKLIDEADVVLGHNSDAFDIRKSNARFMFHGLNPPSPYKTIDTVKIARQYFFFNSNKLDDLGKHLGLGTKLKHSGFALWKGCMEGNKESWDTMVKYNKMDVVLLEKIYLKLRPWLKNHPNMNQYTDEKHNCPKCGGSHLQSRGFTKTLASLYRRFHCQDCGAWSRSNKCEKETRVQVTNL